MPFVPVLDLFRAFGTSGHFLHMFVFYMHQNTLMRQIVLEVFTGRINVLLQTQGLAAPMLRDSPPATVCLCFKSIKSL